MLLATVLVLAGTAKAWSDGPQPDDFVSQVAPEQSNFWGALRYSTQVDAPRLQGSDQWDCKPNQAHPRPVILVHGTWVDPYLSFAALAPRLARAGYCVFSPHLGKTTGAATHMAGLHGTQSIQQSSQDLARFTQKVLDTTGAKQVDMVGWSQGGVLIRSYLKHWGGALPDDPEGHKVKRVVTLGAPHRGTSLSGVATLVQWAGWLEATPKYIGASGRQMVEASAFLQELNAGGETFPGIEYTAIYSPYDEVVNPPQNATLKAVPGATVHNIDVTQDCALDFSTHEALPYSERSLALVMRALDPQASIDVACKLQLASF